MSEEEAVYEMFWDCKYCGQQKLLGLTHRFCATCGAAQDPDARYFPPDEDKVAVHDHIFVGADVSCPACNQPMAKESACCTNCGSPLQEGVEVRRQKDIIEESLPPPAPAMKTSTLILGGVAIGCALLITAALVAVFWKNEGLLVVTSQTWLRTIEIQRFEPTRKSVWCDEAPAGAREISRHKDQKGTTKTEDGQTCTTKKKDQGNGTFKEVKECTPKYKETPVMADKCDVELTEWHTSRTLTANGTAPDAPHWPDVSLGRTGTCVGCEREGPRTEKYTVNFSDGASGKGASCDLPENHWDAFTKGSKWKGKVRVVTADVDCDALVRP